MIYWNKIPEKYKYAYMNKYGYLYASESKPKVKKVEYGLEIEYPATFYALKEDKHYTLDEAMAETNYWEYIVEREQKFYSIDTISQITFNLSGNKYCYIVKDNDSLNRLIAVLNILNLQGDVKYSLIAELEEHFDLQEVD